MQKEKKYIVKEFIRGGQGYKIDLHGQKREMFTSKYYKKKKYILSKPCS